jgi:hypothetical protein
MEFRIVRAGVFAALAVVTGVATAQQTQTPATQPSALSAPALARCATQVQTLRAESARLLQTNAEYEVRRNTYNARSATLKAERDALKPDDLAASLAWKQAQQSHQALLVAFNADVEKLKSDIRAINVVKADYDVTCAGRPYRRQDLEAMPEAARNAMSSGLGGVQVPTLGP